MNRVLTLIILSTASLLAGNGYSLSITCKPPKVIKETFLEGELQWYRHESKDEGEFEDGYVIDGFIPAMRNGATFTRLLVYVGGEHENLSFEVATEIVGGEGVGFTFEKSKHLTEGPIFRAYYYSQDVCPETLYIVETSYSNKEE